MDDEFNTTKKPIYTHKDKSRRWSNCFGLVNKFKRLKNRLSTIHTNDTLQQQPIPSQRKSTLTLSNVYPRHYSSHYYQQRHAHSASTIATFSPQLSSVDTLEQQQQQQQQHKSLTPPVAAAAAATYHLSLLSTTPSPSLSPPPRHGQIGRSHAFSDTSSTQYCNDWRQFTATYQKMTLRLSLDTESINQPNHHQRNSNNVQDDNTNDSNCMADSPVDAVASVRNSMLLYQEDDVSTLRANSNYSTISNSSSLTPQAPPFRSGTLGHPHTLKNQTKAPPLPSSPVTHLQRQPPSSMISSNITTTSSCNHRWSMGSSSRASDLSSIDLPLKERRRRRSPLMFGENDRLTLPIPRNEITYRHSINSNDNDTNKRRMDGSIVGMVTTVTTKHGMTAFSNDDHDTKLKSREQAMQQLEGVSQSTMDGKVISMNRIASTKSLDEQLGDPTLMMNKAHYDAVVSQTIRRPSSPMANSHQLKTPPLLTQSSSASMTPPPSSSGIGNLENKNSIVTLSSSFLPTPSSSSSPPPPPSIPHSQYLSHSHHHPFPSTPNSMDSYL
ncbi:hypothetical protein BC941DRAFT_411906 [Chlamydoabsidia padenii]|nr:hypothetical protein BC941DRAFT_411906 [Chlamydoabsidia padenii]